MNQPWEFLGFLRQIEKSVPDDLDVHLVVDNYCTHKHAKDHDWLAQRLRFHVHYTPTYAMAQPGGALVWDHDAASDPAPQLLQRPAAVRTSQLFITPVTMT